MRFIAIPLILASGRRSVDSPGRADVRPSAAIHTLMLAAIAYRLVPRLSVRLVRWRLDELRMLYGFGLPSFFIMFAVRLVSFSDTTIIGIMLGASSVAIYSLPLQLMEYARASGWRVYERVVARLDSADDARRFVRVARGLSERHADCVLSDRLARRQR